MLAFLPGGIGMTEMLVVGVVAVLLFGSRLPSVARSAGKSLTEFRRGMQDLQHEFSSAMNEAETAATTPAAGTQGRLPADVAHDDSVSDEAYDQYDPEQDASESIALEEGSQAEPVTADAATEADPDADRREGGE
ncbi:twin arginine translocase protein A [Planctomycetes bacterium MalM25]|nr:twin arginine translocase protein A [Planctomycetes bacterium MalM25]